MTTDVNTLPDLSSDYALTSDQAAAFQRDGHILLRGVASRDEVEAYRGFITQTAMQHAKEKRPLAERDLYHQAFIQVGNLWRHSEEVKRFVMARRFAKIAAELLGVKAVRLYHDQALLKEGGGGHTPWHQDQLYWPLDTDNTVTMWMPLVDCPVDMGALTFASGTHRAPLRCRKPISEESHREISKYVADNKCPVVVNAMSAGDATFHYGWTMHAAPPNRSDRTREVMTVIHCADGARLVTNETEQERADREAWYPGRKPGDLAESELTPVLYRNDE